MPQGRQRRRDAVDSWCCRPSLRPPYSELSDLGDLGQRSASRKGCARYTHHSTPSGDHEHLECVEVERMVYAQGDIVQDNVVGLD